MINSNFGFTPLKEVWLGDCYPASFYDHLPNEISDPFRLITEYTHEDTARLQQFLESRGITVRRPKFGSIDNYIDHREVLVKPPVSPRDDYMVLDQTLYRVHNVYKHDPWQHCFDLYQEQGFDARMPKDLPINCLHPPSIVKVGKDLYLDTVTHENAWGFACEWMVNAAHNYRINICNTAGHSDGVFCPVSEGVIVSSHYKADYSQSFPDWEVFHIPENLNNFDFSLKHEHWFVNDSTVMANKAFAQHISDVAKDWVGTCAETVFEVNMLVLDPKNVVALKEYPPLFEWLEKRGITVHLFDNRTRSFWDSGWHCSTLDIHREDTPIDLFPNRGPNGVYWRLN